MIPQTNTWQIGDILKVKQGDEIHFEKVIQLSPEILTIDMNENEEGDITTQSLSDAAGITYELITNNKLSSILKNWIPKNIAFAIADRFYGSDYPMARSTFENALKEFDY